VPARPTVVQGVGLSAIAKRQGEGSVRAARTCTPRPPMFATGPSRRDTQGRGCRPLPPGGQQGLRGEPVSRRPGDRHLAEGRTFGFEFRGRPPKGPPTTSWAYGPVRCTGVGPPDRARRRKRWGGPPCRAPNTAQGGGRESGKTGGRAVSHRAKVTGQARPPGGPGAGPQGGHEGLTWRRRASAGDGRREEVAVTRYGKDRVRHEVREQPGLAVLFTAGAELSRTQTATGGTSRAAAQAGMKTPHACGAASLRVVQRERRARTPGTARVSRRVVGRLWLYTRLVVAHRSPSSSTARRRRCGSTGPHRPPQPPGGNRSSNDRRQGPEQSRRPHSRSVFWHIGRKPRWEGRTSV